MKSDPSKKRPVRLNRDAAPVGAAEDDTRRTAMMAVLKRLSVPFMEADLGWFVREDDVVFNESGRGIARAFPFVTARAVQQRLDDVFAGCWSSRLIPAAFGATRPGVVCEIAAFLPDVGWVTKSDASDLTLLEPVKGGASGALKRAAVQWGIGRYLYALPDLTVEVVPGSARQYHLSIKNRPFTWDPPLLPPEALPSNLRKARATVLASAAARAASDAGSPDACSNAIGEESSAPPADSHSIASSGEEAADPSGRIPGSTGAGEAELASESSVSQPGDTAASPEQIEKLRTVLWATDDEAFAVTYLKFKRFLPLAATSLNEICARHAETILRNEQKVKDRMSILTRVAQHVAGRDQHAATYFVAIGMIKPGSHWFTIESDAAQKVADNPGPLIRSLDKIAAAEPAGIDAAA